MTQLTTTAPDSPRFAIKFEDFDGPKPFEKGLITRLKRPKHALAHLKGALKRDKNTTDAEHRSLVLLALAEIGVAHGVLAKAVKDKVAG